MQQLIPKKQERKLYQNNLFLSIFPQSILKTYIKMNVKLSLPQSIHNYLDFGFKSMSNDRIRIENHRKLLGGVVNISIIATQKEIMEYMPNFSFSQLEELTNETLNILNEIVGYMIGEGISDSGWFDVFPVMPSGEDNAGLVTMYGNWVDFDWLTYYLAEKTKGFPLNHALTPKQLLTTNKG